MTLDDKFNPNDGSFIDRADNRLFEFSKGIAKLWQDKTYRSKKDLERYLYIGSSIAFFNRFIHYKLYIESILVITNGLKAKFEELRPRSTINETISSEAIGLPSKTIKYLNVGLYTLGTIDLLAAGGFAIAGLVSGERHFYNTSLKELLYGVGVCSWITADYVAKSDIGEPPKKSERKSVKEWMKEKLGRLVPKHEPLPNPVGAYSTLENYV